MFFLHFTGGRDWHPDTISKAGEATGRPSLGPKEDQDLPDLLANSGRVLLLYHCTHGCHRLLAHSSPALGYSLVPWLAGAKKENRVSPTRALTLHISSHGSLTSHGGHFPRILVLALCSLPSHQGEELGHFIEKGF